MTGQCQAAGHMLVGMKKSASKGLFIAYIVVAVLMALMMFFSASMKLTLNPGAVQVIHDVVGVPMGLFPVLAACEIAGGIGLLVGIWRPGLGVAAGVAPEGSGGRRAAAVTALDVVKRGESR